MRRVKNLNKKTKTRALFFFHNCKNTFQLTKHTEKKKKAEKIDKIFDTLSLQLFSFFVSNKKKTFLDVFSVALNCCYQYFLFFFFS